TGLGSHRRRAMEIDLLALEMSRATAHRRWCRALALITQRLNSGQIIDPSRWFSDRLRRAAPSLRTLGINIRERRDAQGSKVNIGRIASLATSATQNGPLQALSNDANVANAAIRSISGAGSAKHHLNGDQAN